MNRRGQGALEYLLLIGGAVLVATIIITLVTGTESEIKESYGYDLETETWTNVEVCAEYMKTGNFAELNMPCEELGPGWGKEQLQDGYLCKKCVLKETKTCLAQKMGGTEFNRRYNYLCSDVIN